ncbi:MAG: flippase-like domain-containing protein [Peptococcaceae bacterium]|nr:flippase-like domain-containing protein [Peptococcaceae bacterium]
MKNHYVNWLITIFIISLTAWIISSSSEIKNIPYLFEITNKRCILVAILCMICYWLIDALIIQAIFSLFHLRLSCLSYLLIAMIGQYYNLITPFSSGGQPAQILKMTNDFKVNPSLATSVTINKFMVYHIVVTIFSLFLSVFKADFILQQSTLSKTFIYLGLTLNALGILAIFATCYNTYIAEQIISLFFRIIKNLPVGKKIRQEAVTRYIHEYRISLFAFLQNIKVLFYVSLLSLAQVFVYFSVTYFVYISLGLSKALFVDILAMQALLYIAVNFIPTPGNAGASEGGFYILFGLFFPSNILVYAIVLWRLIVYYFNLVASGCVVFIDYIFKRLQNSHKFSTP